MLDRLRLLEENVSELVEFKNRHTVSDIKSDKSKEWALRYGLLESIQIVVDISCHLTTKYNLGNPSTYADCIEFLRRYKYLEDGLADKLTGMVGLRNILVHEYITVDVEKLYGLLNNINDFKEFADKIKDLV